MLKKQDSLEKLICCDDVPVFRYASVSDVHLGHPRTHASHTIASLNKCIVNDEYLSTIDVLIIVGDLFDRGLRWNEDIIADIEDWVFRTLTYCARNKTALWILEGTPSHDREQSRVFERFNIMFSMGCNLRYIDKTSVFYDKQFGLHFLFIPDGEANTDLTWETTNQLLAENGIDKVDFAFIHGAFRYQLPEVANTPKHIEERYLSIVRYVINTGHIHHASVFDRIHSNGSFDRVDHNYETPKGFWDVTLRAGEYQCTFIQNKDAKIYLTIDCRGLSVEDALRKIQLTLEANNVEDSYFRIWARDDDPILAHMGELKRRYKLYNWSSPKQEITTKQTVGETTVEGDKFVVLQITTKTLPDIIRGRLVSSNTDSMLTDAILSVMEELEVT